MNTNGSTFVLSQYKINLIYKNIDDLKRYWDFPIHPYGQYWIQPSGLNNEWRINKIWGYKLDYILEHATEINNRLSSRYRLTALALSNVKSLVQKISPKAESTAVFETELELYRWQEEALDIWCGEEEGRGIVEAATGTGKTRLAFACMEEFLDNCPDGLVCVVVPRQPLFDQWQEGLLDHFLDIPERNYCLKGNDYSDDIHQNTQVIITTQQSMVRNKDSHYGCELLKLLVKSSRDVLIVFDEAHHLGATQTMERFVKHIPDDFYTLGLTATPDRIDGAMDNVYKHFGWERSDGPIYSYDVSSAVEDEVLTKVVQKNYTVTLSDDEDFWHDQYCEQIKDIKKRIINNSVINVDREKIQMGNIAYLVKLENNLLTLQKQKPSLQDKIWNIINKIRALKTIYFQRRRLFNKAENKWELLRLLLSDDYWIEQFSNGRWIFFHQEIEECDKTARLLSDVLGWENVRSHHSQMKTDERQNILAEFDRGQFNCLCAVQTLDEGLDIPDLNGIVIMSGSTTKRQQIQRCGRALRRAPNKDNAFLVIFLAQSDDDQAGEKLLIGPDYPTDRWTIENYALVGVDELEAEDNDFEIPF